MRGRCAGDCGILSNTGLLRPPHVDRPSNGGPTGWSSLRRLAQPVIETACPLVQGGDVPAPFLQPVHVRLELRGEAFPICRVEDARIFLQAGQDFVLSEHRIANVTSVLFRRVRRSRSKSPTRAWDPSVLRSVPGARPRQGLSGGRSEPEKRRKTGGGVSPRSRAALKAVNAGSTAWSNFSSTAVESRISCRSAATSFLVRCSRSRAACWLLTQTAT